MHLVPGNRKQIAPNPLNLERDLPCRLHGIGMKVNIGLGGNLADFPTGCSTPVSLLAIMSVISLVF